MDTNNTIITGYLIVDAAFPYSLSSEKYNKEDSGWVRRTVFENEHVWVNRFFKKAAENWYNYTNQVDEDTAILPRAVHVLWQRYDDDDEDKIVEETIETIDFTREDRSDVFLPSDGKSSLNVSMNWFVNKSCGGEYHIVFNQFFDSSKINIVEKAKKWWKAINKFVIATDGFISCYNPSTSEVLFEEKV